MNSVFLCFFRPLSLPAVMQTDVCDISVNTTWKGFCSGGLPALTARTPTYCTVQRSDVTETQVLMFPTRLVFSHKLFGIFTNDLFVFFISLFFSVYFWKYLFCFLFENNSIWLKVLKVQGSFYSSHTQLYKI